MSGKYGTGFRPGRGDARTAVEHTNAHINAFNEEVRRQKALTAKAHRATLLCPACKLRLRKAGWYKLCWQCFVAQAEPGKKAELLLKKAADAKEVRAAMIAVAARKRAMNRK